jgi:hypothetical protein
MTVQIPGPQSRCGERHPAWGLLRLGNATLILSFLGGFVVEGNRGACSTSEVAAALDDHLYTLNAAISTLATTTDRYGRDSWKPAAPATATLRPPRPMLGRRWGR